MEKIRRKKKFQHMCVVPSSGKLGGVTLFWIDPSQIQLIHTNKNMIDVRILHPSNPTWWRLSCVYGNSNSALQVA